MRKITLRRTGAVAILASLALAACDISPRDGAKETEPASGTVETGSATADDIDARGGAATGSDADRAVDALAQDNFGGSDLASIPAAFRGTWATGAQYCANANHNRFIVTGTDVRFFEDGGAATDIRGEGNALAVTWRQRDPDDVTRARAVYFARESSGTMRVRLGDNESITYRRCEVKAASADGGSRQAALVPERFRGLYAQDRRACERDYTYQPAFRNVTINARDVVFFETGGPVIAMNVDGDAIAITVRETVGDTVTIRAIYLRLIDKSTVRYRPGRGEPVETRVRC